MSVRFQKLPVFWRSIPFPPASPFTGLGFSKFDPLARFAHHASRFTLHTSRPSADDNIELLQSPPSPPTSSSWTKAREPIGWSAHRKNRSSPVVLHPRK